MATDSAKVIAQASRIIQQVQSETIQAGALAEAVDLTRVFGGANSAFHRALAKVSPGAARSFIEGRVTSVLEGFIRHIENGLVDEVSIERQARVDVVSDFLEQAQRLLETKDIHPGAAAVLIGASLEEFLRNWVEDKELSVGPRKPSIDAYASVLRESDLITKQDVKDIIAWGGIRNAAAHGKWEEVEDRTRVRMMLEGVNLFLRRYIS
jgi:hypothetical protein